jgi:AraC-like DNA-binding protein
MGPTPSIRAWRPPVAGVVEVLHAHFPSHAYPSHTHDTWTVLLVDDGVVRFDLDRHELGAVPHLVMLLPPGVPHDGRSVTAGGFRKRVVYLEEDVIGADRVGAAVDHPGWRDPALLAGIERFHRALAHPGDAFEAESAVAVLADGLRSRLAGADPPRRTDAPLARRVRALLDDRVTEGVVLADVAAGLGAHPSHLVRSFAREYGIAPHRYLTGRRLDLARRLLLAGVAPAEVADAAGFYDQAHLTRHFRRFLGTTPAAYARSAATMGA